VCGTGAGYVEQSFVGPPTGICLGVGTGLFFAHGFTLDAVQLLRGLCFIEAEQYLWI
jgi:hypothetical protein